MSVDSLAIDFNNSLSFDLPQVVNLEKRNIVSPPIKVVKREKNRNRQCMPSDDEDEDEEIDEEDDDEEEDDRITRKQVFITPKPVRKSCPLPSDDEDSEDERGQEEQEGDVHFAYQNPRYDDDDDDDDDKALMPSNGLQFMEGTHLQQLHHKQQQHQAQLAQFQYYQHRSKIYHQQNMSGMDLLKQLEQEKAEAKKTKPKLDTSKVKMKGLLGKLPEPGSHNISFQQLEQQQRKMQSRSSQQYMDPRQYVDPRASYTTGQYLDPQQFTHAYPPRSPSPNSSRHRAHHHHRSSK